MEDVKFSADFAALIDMAASIEHLLRCDLWVQAIDGKFYRPEAGWRM